MKTAIVYHFFPHYREGVLRELERHSEHQFVLAGDRDTTDSTIRAARTPASMEYVVCPCRPLPGGATWQSGLIQLARRPDIDTIIYLGCPEFASTWVSAAVARLSGKRVLYWTHGWTRRDKFFRSLAKRAFFRLAHSLLLYGNIAKKLGMECRFPEERMHVIYNSLNYDQQSRIRDGIGPEELRNVRRYLFPDPTDPILICTARLTAACRFDLLLNAQRLLLAQGHPVNVLLVGDGPERARLQDAAKDLGWRVRFYGECYDEPLLARLIMAADATVSPGKVGLTAIHSMAYGRPVITHQNFDRQGPEVEAIVPGRTGDLFCEGDVWDLAEAIHRWTPAAAPAAQVRADCIRIVERFYNPSYQRRAIDRALNGERAPKSAAITHALLESQS